ncbi:hypothetical protein [Sabulibacter ruber]|uniref:hypothetical protein n=1 Tax=Sabulibacter ruber TaxID=2811901 RepID=UPI001A95BA30|nr:hypothetical protein [Sabulibacter ruber]
MSWGNGGGVGGKVTEYVLLPNGQLFQKEPFTKQVKELASVSEKEAARMFQQATELDLSFKHPGNVYQFIKLGEESNPGKEAVWGSHQFTPPTEVQALYRQLQALVQK